MATKRSILTSASEDRLEKLIEERLKKGSDKVLKIGDSDVFGAQVNAARAWEILVTGAVKQQAVKASFPGVSFDKIDDVPPGAREAYRVNYALDL